MVHCALLLKLRGNIEFENGLRKTRCYMHRSRELAEINWDIVGAKGIKNPCSPPHLRRLCVCVFCEVECVF